MSKTDGDLSALNISQLQALKTTLTSQYERINSQLTSLSLELQKVAKQRIKVETALNHRLKPTPEPRLSDHAVLRFIERKYNIDVGAIKSRIMSGVVIDAIKGGASAVTVDGIKLKIVDNAIVTAYQAEPPKSKHTPRQPNELKEGLDEYYSGGLG